VTNWADMPPNLAARYSDVFDSSAGAGPGSSTTRRWWSPFARCPADVAPCDPSKWLAALKHAIRKRIPVVGKRLEEVEEAARVLLGKCSEPNMSVAALDEFFACRNLPDMLGIVAGRAVERSHFPSGE
jgi:hypothetical protein